MSIMLYKSFKKERRNSSMKLSMILLAVTSVHFFSNKVLTLNMQEKPKPECSESNNKNREGVEKCKNSCTLHSFSKSYQKLQWEPTQFRNLFICINSTFAASIGWESAPPHLARPPAQNTLKLELLLLPEQFSFGGISAYLGQVEQKYRGKAKGEKK